MRIECWPLRRGTDSRRGQIVGQRSSIASIARWKVAKSDDTLTIDDPAAAMWVSGQRRVVEDYLKTQGCEHGGVSLEPRWYASPHVAVWAVRSRSNPDFVGWWAISGDLPTDYMTASPEIGSVPSILAAFAARWSTISEAMSKGEESGIGRQSDAASLAPLLSARVQLLESISRQLDSNEGLE